MRKLKMLTFLIVLVTLLASCTSSAKLGGMSNSKAKATREGEEKKILIEGDEYPYTVTDYMNNKTVIENSNIKWAVTSGTYINLWYRLGGKSVCTTDLGSALIDEAYKDEISAIPSIGAVYNPNTELLMEHGPDVILAQMGVQTGMINTMHSMGKKCIMMHMRSYNDVLNIVDVFGKLLNNEAEANEIIRQMEADKKEITDQLPSRNKTVAILYVTSKSLSVKLDNSIAGDVAEILKLENIASSLPPDTIGSETAPLDIEYIADKNPDIILVTSMISSNEEAKRVMDEQFNTNPVWKTVEAVSKGSVKYLPQQYFLYNSAHHYVEAIEYMAKCAYPEIYGGIDE